MQLYDYQLFILLNNIRFVNIYYPGITKFNFNRKATNSSIVKLQQIIIPPPLSIIISYAGRLAD